MILGAEPLEERVDLAADAAGDAAEIVGHRLHRAGAGAGVVGGGADQIDPFGGLDRALGGDLDAARDFRRGGALLGDGGRDGAADIADLADDVLDRGDRLDRAHGGALHAGDLCADLLGGAAGLAGQRLHLAGHHGETAPGLAGARGFAVVAGEVKALAGQTSRATEEITAQIAGMQRATVRSIEAITAIERMIREIGDISGAIAAAVTEQGAATAEIARSVEIAAKRTVETADEVNLVGTATEDTRSSAGAVKTVADDLGNVAGRIRGQVDAFFQRLSA